MKLDQNLLKILKNKRIKFVIDNDNPELNVTFTERNEDFKVKSVSSSFVPDLVIKVAIRCCYGDVKLKRVDEDEDFEIIL